MVKVPTEPTQLNESCLLIPRPYIDRIIERLENYGYHRDEIFMTRRTAKEAADLIKLLAPDGSSHVRINAERLRG